MGATFFTDGCSRGASVSSSGVSVSPARAAATWAAEHPKGWTLDIHDGQPEHRLKPPDWSGGCKRGPAAIGTAQVREVREQPSSSADAVTLRYATSDTVIDFGFRCPIRVPVTADALNAALFYVALDKLPHGIAVPHWEFEIATPVSSFREGVRFTAVGEGRLKVRIETGLYSIYGKDTRPACVPPEDASMRPECFVNHEHRIPLTLTMEIPFDPSLLD